MISELERLIGRHRKIYLGIAWTALSIAGLSTALALVGVCLNWGFIVLGLFAATTLLFLFLPVSFLGQHGTRLVYRRGKAEKWSYQLREIRALQRTRFTTKWIIELKTGELVKLPYTIIGVAAVNRVVEELRGSVDVRDELFD